MSQARHIQRDVHGDGPLRKQRVEYKNHGASKELAAWTIDYADLVLQVGESVEILQNYMHHKLASIWRDIYLAQFPNVSEVQVIEIGAASYLYDCTWSEAQIPSSPIEVIPDDRVVAVHGISRAAPKPRNKSRMAGTPRGGLGIVLAELKDSFERGHYVARSFGGGEDINLFPQWKPINQGLSEAGKIFRKMERYCEMNNGTHFFLRPFYHGISDHPAAVEFGIVMSDASLWINIFPNVSSLEYLECLDSALIDVRRDSGKKLQN